MRTMTRPTHTHRGGLHRSRHNKVIAGVAGGIAETTGIPPWVVRLVFLAMLLPGGVPGSLIYLALWVFLPKR